MGHVAGVREKIGVHRILLLRPRHRWEGSGKSDIKEIEWRGVD